MRRERKNGNNITIKCVWVCVCFYTWAMHAVIIIAILATTLCSIPSFSLVFYFSLFGVWHYIYLYNKYVRIFSMVQFSFLFHFVLKYTNPQCVRHSACVCVCLSLLLLLVPIWCILHTCIHIICQFLFLLIHLLRFFAITNKKKRRAIERLKIKCRKRRWIKQQLL